MDSPIEPLVSLREERSVYALTFSPDGRYLVWGGGSSTGLGFLRWCSVSSPNAGELELSEPADPEWKISVELAQRLGLRGVTGLDLFSSHAVSGLAFDQYGHNLALTMWSLGHRNVPSVVTAIEGGALQMLDIFPCPPDENQSGHERKRRLANGVVLMDDKLIVHRWASAERCLEFHSLAFRCGVAPHHRTSSRIAPLGRGWFATGSQTGLVLVHQDGSHRTVSGTDVSAICCEPLGGAFTTGDSRGRLTHWRFQLDQENLQPETEFVCPSGHQIEALGYLKGGLLVVGCRGGTITLWRGNELLGGKKMPGFSVRTLTCHPSLPCAAVGGKSPIGNGQMHLLWFW